MTSLSNIGQNIGHNKVNITNYCVAQLFTNEVIAQANISKHKESFIVTSPGNTLKSTYYSINRLLSLILRQL